MKYFKAFNNGLKCQGKQYAENTDFEENGNHICEAGMMHFCETPFDTLDYYPLVDKDGNFSEFAEVKPLDEVVKKDNKCASRKIHIGAKLSFKEFIKAGADILIEKTRFNDNTSDLNDKGKRFAKIGSSGYGAKIGSSGYGAKIGSSGDGAQIGSSGDGAQIKMQGERSVTAAVGYKSSISGKKGDWIVLAEWKRNLVGQWYPACVKAGQIDGETLKEDTMYHLEDGEFKSE